ncbi:MAG: hypothetical protein AB7Y46_08380 [Armatimonadota bacterium]
MMKVSTLALMMLACTAAAAQEEPLEDFWRRGHVRELLVRGIDEVTLEQWAQVGVNCVMGVPPAEAHALGMRTRTWFTMNFINPRAFGDDLEVIRTMAAESRDGSLRRPYDPLFPTVANNYSACVNKPAWREYAAGRFRTMAQEQWDGCHIDYASHYEPCLCEHCQAAWRDFALERGLDSLDLLTLPDDMRTRLHEREFRIRCVMDFLGMVRDEARAIRPGFGTDGTWHQDSGTTYQWAYGRELPSGEHFDLMCIEGTTWGPFPPRSQQILWLKLAHALTRGQVAMSVTYHLLTDGGERHHGRMASDRARVALCEIMSQGGVSWLGLGGPNTGNLLREHAAMVQEVYATWAALEPQLTARREVGDVAIVFSPRSYLVSGASRQQLYAIGQALMRAHVPFVIHSDVGLTAAALAACPATVVLDAAALTDEAVAALQAYVAGGGRVLFVGEMPRYAADWSERPDVPDLFVRPEGDEGVASKPVGGHEVWYALGDPMAGSILGAVQTVAVAQETAGLLAVEGESKALGVSGGRNADYSLYVDLTYADGTPLWGQIAPFAPGSHDWESARCIIAPAQPVRSARVHLLFRNHGGTAWFRRVKFGPWDPETGQITENLLADGAWEPYGEGYELEEIAGEGPTIVATAARGVLAVGDMHEPDPAALDGALEFLAPVLPAQPMLRVEGDGASQVYCDVALTDGGALLQLINYNAELHPELGEFEQQQADRTIPVESLQVTFHPSDGRELAGLTLLVPGQPSQPLAHEAGTFTLPRLGAYAAVIVDLR